MTKYKLEQKGRWINISPEPELKLLRRLVRDFSYTKKGAEFMANPAWAQVKLYQPGRKRFPIGLLSSAERIFKELGLDYEKQVNRAILSDLEQLSGGLYDFQRSALRMLLIRSGGILQIPTGGGKTRTAIAAINSIKKKTLVVCPTVDLVNQWKKQVSDDVDVRTYQGIKSKSYVQEFGLVIFDECHRVAAKTLQLIGLNLNEEAVTIGLSATPFMRDDDNLKVESVLGKVVYKISLRELINEGYLVDALVHYHKLDTMDTDFMDYPMAYTNYITKNTERNCKIVEIARESPGPVLILVKHIEHGKFLKEELEMYNQDVVFLNGGSKKRDEKMEHKIIIATSIFDEGIDIPRLETLIMGGGGKSAIKSTQRIGRVLRKHPGKGTANVHDFKDNCKWLSGHYKERRQIYEQDFEVVDVE